MGTLKWLLAGKLAQGAPSVDLFPHYTSNLAFFLLELGLVDGQELAVADVTTPQTVLFKLHFTS